MAGDKPARQTIRCADSAGRPQHLHIDSTYDGRVVAHRARGAALYLDPDQVALVVLVLALHFRYVVRRRPMARPLRLTVPCSASDGSPVALHVESDDHHVLALREGGIFLHLTPRAVLHTIDAMTTHARWVLPRWTT
jgi:hypothetical protein